MESICVQMIGGIRKYERGVFAKMEQIYWLNMNGGRLYHGLKLYNKIMYNKCPNYLYQKIN